MKYLIVLLLLTVKLNLFGYTLNQDTTISGTWNLSNTTLLINNVKISGTGTISNAIIVCNNPFIQIFDTTITLLNCKTKEFSIMWYGAAPAKPDNWGFMQKASDMCIANNIRNLYIPRGVYSFGSPWTIKNWYIDRFIGATINIYGDGDYWDDASTLNYTAYTACAVGFQVAKGGSIHGLKIQGRFVSPAQNGTAYFSRTMTQFKGANATTSGYAGICIDYDGTKGASGSSSLKVYDMWVDGFDICYNISPNGVTDNAELLRFTNVRCGNAIVGFQCGQAQEKGNIIDNIVSWDNLHTLISIGNAGKYQGGNYIIKGGNVAGNCIRLFNIAARGWFPIAVYDLYAEGVGEVGDIFAGDGVYNPTVSFTSCSFDMAFKTTTGKTNIVFAGNTGVIFDRCVFRYFGDVATSMGFLGNATYINCNLPTNKSVQSSNIVLTPQSISAYGIAPKIRVIKP